MRADNTPVYWYAHMRKWAVLLLVVAVLVVAVPGGQAASSSVTVTGSVPSWTSLINNCTNTAAWDFGTIVPGSSNLTATGANVCSLTFSSNNDTAMIRLRQKDATAGALGKASTTLTEQTESEGIQEIDMISASVGWAVGGNGVYRTVDSGVTWTPTAVNPGCCPLSVAAVSSTTAFVQKQGITVLRTTDSGASWIDVSPTGIANLGDIAAFDANTVYAVGNAGTIVQTTNGGTNWTNQTAQSGTIVDFYQVSVIDASNVWASGQAGVVRRTTDGGSSWLVKDLPQSWKYGFGLGALNASTAIVATQYDLFCTADGGTTWTQHYPSPNAWLWDAYFASASVVYAAGDFGTVVKSSDGCATWTTTPAGTASGNLVQSLDGVGTSNVWAGGTGEAIVATADGGSSWTVQRQVASSLYAVTATDALTVLVVGSRGKIRRTTNGGTLWSDVASGTTSNLWGVDLGSDTTAWAVGDGGTILTSGDAGASWSPQTSLPAASFQAVSAVDQQTAWVVGSGGAIRKTTNGGTTWTAQSSGVTTTLRSVSAIDGNVVWAAGDGDTIRKTTNGGTTWASPAATPPVGYEWRSISATDSQTAYVLAYDWGSNGIYVTRNGGVSWTVCGYVNMWLTALDAATATTVYAVGGDGGMRRSDDGCASWTTLIGNTGNQLFGVFAVDANTAFITADANAIYKSDPPAVAIADFAAGVNDWDQGADMFGVCLQDVALAATVAAPWVEDVTNTPGQCQTTDLDPWRAIPTAGSKVAFTSAAGASGRIDLVWGLRPSGSQQPGKYFATVLMEVRAPNV